MIGDDHPVPHTKYNLMGSIGRRINGRIASFLLKESGWVLVSIYGIYQYSQQLKISSVELTSEREEIVEINALNSFGTSNGSRNIRFLVLTASSLVTET